MSPQQPPKAGRPGHRAMPTRFGDNVVIADFGARRRHEAVKADNGPRAPRSERESWAASQIMTALADNSDSGRLARGREYYRGGKVLGVELTKDCMAGLVDGTQLEPFDVSLRLRPLASRKAEFIKDELMADPSHVRSILHGSAPGTEVAAMLLRPDHVFQATCTCPDRSVVCKHVVAVGYAVAARLTQDPLHVLRLRGIDPEPFVTQLSRKDESAGVTSLRSRREGRKLPEEASEEKKHKGDLRAELVDPKQFWGAVDQRVTWGTVEPESGLEQGDKQAIMAALRTVSWTGVDQLRAHHELERCYEVLMENEQMFDNLPWEHELQSRPDDKDRNHD